MGTEAKKREAWRAAFDAQATTAVLDKVYRAARARMRIYSGRTQHVDTADVDDMVNGVLTDTLDGSLKWSYQTKPLLRHLLDTVKYRVRDQARRRWREKARVEVLDEETTDASVGESMVAGAQPQRPDDSLRMRQIADAVLSEIMARVSGDREVIAVLEAIIHGAHERSVIMKETGLSARAYKNARRRLDYILLQLPTQTREAAMAALTN